jgi:hypothetical protein
MNTSTSIHVGQSSMIPQSHDTKNRHFGTEQMKGDTSETCSTTVLRYPDTRKTRFGTILKYRDTSNLCPTTRLRSRDTRRSCPMMILGYLDTSGRGRARFFSLRHSRTSLSEYQESRKIIQLLALSGSPGLEDSPEDDGASPRTSSDPLLSKANGEGSVGPRKQSVGVFLFGTCGA